MNTAITQQISKTVQLLNNALQQLPADDLNKSPGTGSWTIGQVTDHIILSTASVNKVLQIDAPSAERDVTERVPDLENIFLNMDIKLKAPAFIIPRHDRYDKPALLHHLNYEFNQLFRLSTETNLSGLIKHIAFGNITKLELLYFVSFHTQRHLQQIKNIAAALQQPTIAMQKITPFFMFTGNAEEAMNFYISSFENSGVLQAEHYDEKGPGKEGTIKHATFYLNGLQCMCIDTNFDHGFSFTPSLSMHITCSSNEEIDKLFESLSKGGNIMMPLQPYPFAKKYAWISDRFGVSWQLSYN